MVSTLVWLPAAVHQGGNSRAWPASLLCAPAGAVPSQTVASVPLVAGAPNGRPGAAFPSADGRLAGMARAVASEVKDLSLAPPLGVQQSLSSPVPRREQKAPVAPLQRVAPPQRLGVQLHGFQQLAGPQLTPHGHDRRGESPVRQALSKALRFPAQPVVQTLPAVPRPAGFRAQLPSWVLLPRPEPQAPGRQAWFSVETA